MDQEKNRIVKIPNSVAANPSPDSLRHIFQVCSSAGVYSIFYYPSSIGSPGSGCRGSSRAGTSRSAAQHIPFRGAVSSALNTLNTRVEWQLKGCTSRSNTSRHLCTHTHRVIPTCRSSTVYNITHILWLSVSHI